MFKQSLTHFECKCSIYVDLSVKPSQSSLGSLVANNDFLQEHIHRIQGAKKEMAAHSSVLAWRIPRTEEPGGLPSVGSHRVRHD